MALDAGHYKSGGGVFDADGRRVLAVAGGSPLQEGEYLSGGRVFDEEGRESVSIVGDVGASLPEGTEGQLLGYDANGDPIAVTVDTDIDAAPVAPLFMAPILGLPTANLSQASINGALRFARFLVPKDGTLTGIGLQIAVSSGNVRVVVYDTGDASAGNRSLLYDSGSVASPGTGNRHIASPAVAVTRGQLLDIGFEVDNATLSLSRAIQPVSSEMPAGYLVASGGASPKLASTYTKATFSDPVPATIAEASMVNGNGLSYGIFARVA